MNIMLTIKDALLGAFNHIRMIGIADVIDILIVAFVIYKLIGIIRKTGSFKVAKGLIVVFAVLWIAQATKMNVVYFALRSAVETGLLAIVILFQPELRRLLEKMGTSRVTSFLGTSAPVRGMGTVITQTLLACGDMQKSRTGALIVFERDNLLDAPMKTGTLINATVTSELLKNIFYPKAPLHDGALIIRDGQIAAAGCMLPLTSNANLSKDLGMRHRAGIGMSEHSDAVVLIVSEENGFISVAVDGMLKRNLNMEMLEKLLYNELMPKADDADKKNSHWLLKLLGEKK